MKLETVGNLWRAVDMGLGVYFGVFVEHVWVSTKPLACGDRRETCGKM